MSKTITLKCQVRLSEKFGGIEHGEESAKLAKGSTLELKSDALADYLIQKGYAVAGRISKK